MSARCYRLCDLIDIVEELLAIVKALPENTLLEDPSERGVIGFPAKLVRERLEDMLQQFWVDQKGFD